MSTLKSYDLNGKKLSFANWISNLSPEETPFVSMTGKESINQVLFYWQNTAMKRPGINAAFEGSNAVSSYQRSTTVRENVTQILRKVVKVSKTTTALSNYGRGNELQYQMEKASKEIKRDLEWVFLNNVGSVNNGVDARKTAGYLGLVSPYLTPCPETGAVVHFQTANDNSVTEADIFKMTYNLYIAGGEANIIMYHPKHAGVFSALQEKDNTRVRMFSNTPHVSFEVTEITDPLGQTYKLIPNKFMPMNKIYFFNPKDFTQMVLRSPKRTQLAKDGSYEKWMIEMECGLRLRHPYAAGVLEVKAGDTSHVSNNDVIDAGVGLKLVGTPEVNLIGDGDTATNLKLGKSLKFKFKIKPGFNGKVSLLKNGHSVRTWEDTAGTGIDKSAGVTVLKKAWAADSGLYSVEINMKKADGSSDYHFVSKGSAVSVGEQAADKNLQPAV